jgi:hypothetical protein
VQREQKAALENKIHDLEARMREKESQHRKLQAETKSAQRDQHSALEKQLRDFQSLLREKESQLRLLQASSKAIQHKSHQDAIDLDEQAEALTKRHIKEINGLAKQIQYLRARCSRAESFREALGYQKKFFLMQIQVYSEWYVIPLIHFTGQFANNHTATNKTSISSHRWVSHPMSPYMNAVRNSSRQRWQSSRRSVCRS